MFAARKVMMGAQSLQIACTYQGIFTSTATTGTTRTYSAAPFGTDSTNRKIVVGILSGVDPAVTVTGVTIGGIAASLVPGTQVYAPASNAINASAQFWEAAVPTGTSGNIVVTYSASPVRVAMFVWSVTGTRQLVAYQAATATGGTTAAMATNLNTRRKRSVVLSIAYAAGSVTITYAGVTSHYNATFDTSRKIAAASHLPTTSENPRAISATLSAVNAFGCVSSVAFG